MLEEIPTDSEADYPVVGQDALRREEWTKLVDLGYFALCNIGGVVVE